MINTSSYPVIKFNNTNISKASLNIQCLLKKSFLTSNKQTLFLPNKNNVCLSFERMTKRKENGYLIEILFNGLNLSAKRIKLYRQKYYVDTHRAELFICYEPITTTFKSHIHKRRLIFFSYDRDLIFNIEKSVKQFKLPNAYTGKGLFERHDSYVIKERKKRK